MLQSTMDEAKMERQVTTMKCLITFIKENNSSDAIHFIDYISGLQGNRILSIMKHLIIMTSDLNYSLLKNKTTGNINVHIISPIEISTNSWSHCIMHSSF